MPASFLNQWDATGRYGQSLSSARWLVPLFGLLAVYLVLSSSLSMFRFGYDYPVKDLLRINADFTQSPQMLTYLWQPQNGHFAPSTLLLTWLDYLSPFGSNKTLLFLMMLANFGCVFIFAQFLNRQVYAGSWEKTLPLVLLLALMLFNPDRGDDIYWGLKIHDTLAYAPALLLSILAIERTLIYRSFTSGDWFVFPALAFLASTSVAGGFLFAASALCVALVKHPRDVPVLLAVFVLLAVAAIVVLDNNGAVERHTGSGSLPSVLARSVAAVVTHAGTYPVSLLERGHEIIGYWSLRVILGSGLVLFSFVSSLYVLVSLIRRNDDQPGFFLIALGVQVVLAPMLYMALISMARPEPVEHLTAYPRFIVWCQWMWFGGLLQLTGWGLLISWSWIGPMVLTSVTLAMIPAYKEGISAARFRDTIHMPREISALLVGTEEMDAIGQRLMRRRDVEMLRTTFQHTMPADSPYALLRTAQPADLMSRDTPSSEKPICSYSARVQHTGRFEGVDAWLIRLQCSRDVDALMLVNGQSQIVGATWGGLSSRTKSIGLSNMLSAVLNPNLSSCNAEACAVQYSMYVLQQVEGTDVQLYGLRSGSEPILITSRKQRAAP